MPPNSTQNLNARLSPSLTTPQRLGGSGIALGVPPIHTYAPPIRIVGTATRYRGGGYHLKRLA